MRINAPPVADAGFAAVAAPGENVTFDGSRSIDPDGAVKGYRWDFRDGGTAEGVSSPMPSRSPDSIRSS